MRMERFKINGLVAAFFAVSLAAMAAAQEAPSPVPVPLPVPSPVPEAAPPAGLSGAAKVARLLEELRNPDEPEWQRVEADLDREWSRSGSAALDVLLERGKDALEQGNTAEAIGHLTALTDHAPDFAQGWNTLASAYYQAGQFGPSLHAIGRALALNPSQYESLTGLGLILEDTGREKEALAAFEAAKSIHPHQPTINEAVERLDHKLSGRAL